MLQLTRISTVAAACLVASTAVLAGEATIYSRSHFEGRALTLQGSDADIAAAGFGDVGSIVVHSGRWQFCSRPAFQGRCESLGPGRYASLTEDWSHRILSVRDMQQMPSHAGGVATIYSRSHFGGRALTLHGSDANIASAGFDDVGSIVVHSGRWEFCSRPGFQGRCEALGPGRYASLTEDWSHRVLSVRDVAQPLAVPERQASSVELFPGPGFRGPSSGIDRDIRSLERRGIGEGVSSIVVNEGVWELCTERRFEGTCRVFPPGRYPRLGQRLDNQVGSIRRVG